MSNSIGIVGRGLSNIKISGSNLIRSDDSSVINNVGETDIPIKVSEVANKLNNIGYNLGCMMCIVGDDLGVVSSGTSITMTKSNIPTLSGGYTTPIKYDYEGNLASELRRIFPEVYNIYNKMNNSETKYIYNSSRYSLDIMNGSVSFNLVHSNNYTNTVSLANIVQKCGGNVVKAIVEMSVRYSISGVIKAKRRTFSALLGGKVNECTININDDVIVECFSGVIKAIPLKSSVDECIIDSCIITYGRI